VLGDGHPEYSTAADRIEFFSAGSFQRAMTVPSFVRCGVLAAR
jgi:hypothetical protein